MLLTSPSNIVSTGFKLSFFNPHSTVMAALLTAMAHSLFIASSAYCTMMVVVIIFWSGFFEIAVLLLLVLLLLLVV
jgi:hypothetical protein